MKRDVLEELIVVKRSGQRVNFNSYKVAVAIKNAFDSVPHIYHEKNINQVYSNVLTFIETNYEDRKTINVEDIQDIIESQLKEKKYLDVYESFNEYRQKRAASRKVFTIKQQHKFVKAMEKIADDNLLKTDTDLTANDVLYQYGKTVAFEFAKSYIIDNKYLRSHEEGNIFIHDLEHFPLGKMSHTHLMLSELLDKSNSIDDITHSIICAKEEVSGEVSIPSLDYLLEPWVIKKFKTIYIDYLTNYLNVFGFLNYINIKKITELIYKENTIPFKNDYSQYILSQQINNIFKQAYDDSILKIKNILYYKICKLLRTLESNKNINPKFSFSFGTNNSEIGKLINQAIIDDLLSLPPLLNVTAIFKVKKSTYKNYMELISEGLIEQKNISLSFVDSTFNKDSNEVEYFSNGIRIFDNYNDPKRSSDGRMIVGTTSINLVRLAFKTETKREFYYQLDEMLELVKNELLSSFEIIGNKNKNNYRILFNDNIMDDEKLEIGQKIRKVIKNGNLHIGLIGLKECVTLFTQDDLEQYHFVLELLKYLQTKCIQFSNETKLNFYVTEPSNSRANKELMALDKAIYGIRKGITEKDSYETISQLSSLKDDYNKLAAIQKLFTGGNMIEIILSKNVSSKKIQDTILELIDSDIGFVRVKVGKT